MIIGFIVVVLVAAGTTLWATGVFSKSKPGTETAATINPSATTEAEAKQVLREVLDARQRGEKFTAYEKSHPDVSIVCGIIELSIDNAVLLRHEIASGATDSDKGSAITVQYKFQVTLVYQSQARTEIRESSLFRVGRSKDGKWVVIGSRI